MKNWIKRKKEKKIKDNNLKKVLWETCQIKHIPNGSQSKWTLLHLQLPLTDVHWQPLIEARKVRVWPDRSTRVCTHMHTEWPFQNIKQMAGVKRNHSMTVGSTLRILVWNTDSRNLLPPKLLTHMLLKNNLNNHFLLTHAMTAVFYT